MLAGLGVVVVLVIGLALSSSSRSEPQIVAAATGGPEMSLSVPSGAFSCGVGSCEVRTEFPFTVAVNVVAGPVAGYALVQNYIDKGVYEPKTSEGGTGRGARPKGNA